MDIEFGLNIILGENHSWAPKKNIWIDLLNAIKK